MGRGDLRALRDGMVPRPRANPNQVEMARRARPDGSGPIRVHTVHPYRSVPCPHLAGLVGHADGWG